MFNTKLFHTYALVTLCTCMSKTLMQLLTAHLSDHSDVQVATYVSLNVHCNAMWAYNKYHAPVGIFISVTGNQCLLWKLRAPTQTP